MNSIGNVLLTEKSFIDKIEARSEIEKLRTLIRKTNFTKEDYNELLYLLTGAEMKFLNLSSREREALGLFFAWIRDFVNIAELTFDFEDFVNKLPREERIRMGIHYLDKIKKLIENTTKFMVDIYLYIARTSLSKSGWFIEKITTLRYEYEYKTASEQIPPLPKQK